MKTQTLPAMASFTAPGAPRIEFSDEFLALQRDACRTLIAARQFLEQRFLPYPSSETDGALAVPSAGNCWAAARFTAKVLAHSATGLLDVQTWRPVAGWCLDVDGKDHRHAFAGGYDSDDRLTIVGDLAADQFGHAEVMLVELDQRFAQVAVIDRRHPQGRDIAKSWWKDWKRERFVLVDRVPTSGTWVSSASDD
jgi:hypothetical protein